MRIDLKPVGTVRSGVKSRGDMGLGGAPAVVELYAGCGKALNGISAQTHVWIIGWLHRADRSVLVARPRKVSSSLRKRGVFALRSPDRPNPLALSCARLLRVNGRKLYLEALDMIDGTPVVDIKPYSVGIDSVPCAAQPDYSRKYAAMSDSGLALTLARLLKNHYLRLGRAQRQAGALVFKYCRVSGMAPQAAGAVVSVGGSSALEDAVEVLFGLGAQVCSLGGGAVPKLRVRRGGSWLEVACSEREVKTFSSLAGLK